MVRFSRHHPPASTSSLAAVDSESSLSSSADDSPGLGAESAVHSVHSVRPSEGVVLHGSVSSRVKRGGGEMSRCVFYRAEDIAEFTVASLKRAVCGVLNTQEAWSIFLGVNSVGKVKGCKMSKRQVSNVGISRVIGGQNSGRQHLG